MKQTEFPFEYEQPKEPEPKRPKGLLAQIEEMKSNGLTATPEFTEKMRELERALGTDTTNPFGTADYEVFEQDLNRMTFSDLQSMASKHGISPSLRAETMKDLLKKAFQNWNRSSMRNAMPAPSEGIRLDPNNPQHAKTIKILNETNSNTPL
jgi:hypothetical protein